MANVISGNAGVAGATIALSGAASASTTSAADGTYSFTGLGAGAYVVTPSLASVTFTPTHLNETIVASDITTANFVAQATTFVSTPQLTDDFQRPDSITLGPDWVATTDINQSLAVVSQKVTPAAIALQGENIRIDAEFANDQFAAVTLDVFGLASFIDVQIRADIGATKGYFVSLEGDGLGSYTLQLNDVIAVTQLGVNFVLSSAPQLGDVLKIQAVGTLITVFYNGTPVISGTSNTAAAGAPIIYMASTAIQTDTAFSLFTAGPVSFIISGSCGTSGAGATVALSGQSSASTMAAAGTGDYSFSGLVPGTYFVTPGLAGHAFSPMNAIVTITTADVTGVDFTLFTPRRSFAFIGTDCGPKCGPIII